MLGDTASEILNNKRNWKDLIFIYIYTTREWATTIGNFMPQRGIEPQWNDQRITDYPTATQRRNGIISVY